MALPLMGMSSFNITIPALSEAPAAAISVPKAPSPTESSSFSKPSLARDRRVRPRKKRAAIPSPLTRCNINNYHDATQHDIRDTSAVPTPAGSAASSPPESPFLQTPAFRAESLQKFDFEDDHVHKYRAVSITGPTRLHTATRPLSVYTYTTPRKANSDSPSPPRIPLSTFHAQYPPSFVDMATTHLHLYPWNDYSTEVTSPNNRHSFRFDDSDALMDLAFSRSFDDLLLCLDDEIEWNRVDRREWRERVEGVVGEGVEYWDDQAFM
ncbi:uncharacterized protein STEHIDRAFT_115883 [Stereum hirsutum FP-91666 SS1]|uniref:Uncharacterized protein n=1 Tax=Stereum hirsutum (strain FP-91666) TaxID=721885 RepID=R7RYG3_STEHR|nr:uncharacterized protein STEHIDRAFT_115883 [Stereum hirsutum FP-91666 SS1]EIM80446.1 hypothetical protein STEHIDRAFT_115883 [Stereum hirsutum FP-91666 SS1]